METVHATIAQQKYQTTIVCEDGKKLISDEPIAMGGSNLGFSPTELLASSLAACTSITLKMYSDRKEWNFEEISVDVAMEVDKANNTTRFFRTIRISGDVNKEQKDRLLTIANACPIHKILSSQIEVNTVINK